MTSKISCFDRAVFRRSVRRTLPLWVLLACYCLLLPLRLLSYCRGVSVCTEDFFARVERTMLDYARLNASVLPFLFGGLLAWVQFSWLFRTNTAYFYAALPVRRETLFLTNYLTGVLLCAAPALLSSLLLWAVGAGFGAAAFVPAMQVFAAAMLGFLLFFSFAVLVCCVVGQMAAMPIVYVILNFTFFVLEAIVRHLLFTFVYGMPYSQSSTMQSFALHATPVLGLLQGGFRVATDWAERDGMYYMELNPQLEGWGYLGALAALGLVFALCAFLLLKHREMERSGDVIAVGWLRPVALYVFTIGCALVLGALMAELFSSNTSDNFWYVLLFLFVGAFVGYFVGKMLLQKTIHVFRSGWLGLGICCLALLLAFGAAEFDLFGYSRYLPERGAVQAAGLTHYQSSGLYTTQDDAFVQDVLALQGLGDLAEQLAVLLDVLAAHDDDGHGDGLGNGLGVGHAVLYGAVGAVGVCGLKVQAQEICAGHGLGLLGVIDHGGAAFVEAADTRFLPLVGSIGNFHTDLGCVLNGRIEGVEGQHVLAADDDCLVTGAQGHGIDLAAGGLRLRNERHCCYPPYVFS